MKSAGGLNLKCQVYGSKSQKVETHTVGGLEKDIRVVVDYYWKGRPLGNSQAAAEGSGRR